jgi:hypothetical protein
MTLAMEEKEREVSIAEEPEVMVGIYDLGSDASTSKTRRPLRRLRQIPPLQSLVPYFHQ